jgi:hypothetical protein
MSRSLRRAPIAIVWIAAWLAGASNAAAQTTVSIGDILARDPFPQTVFPVVDNTASPIGHEALLFVSAAALGHNRYAMVNYRNVYLLDVDRGRLVQFSVVERMGDRDCGAISMAEESPTAVAFDQATARLAVANYTRNDNLVFLVDSDRAELCLVDEIEDEATIGPEGIAFSADGHALASANYDGSTISLYRESDEGWIRSWVTSFPNPHGIAFDGGDLVVTSLGDKTIGRFDAATGAMIGEAGGPGIRNELLEFLHPTSVFTRGSELVVTDARTSRVAFIDKATLAVRLLLGAFGPGRGNLDMPFAAVPIEDGRLMVLSTYQQRVLILDPDALRVGLDVVFDAPQWSGEGSFGPIAITSDNVRRDEPSVVLWGSEYKLSHGGLTSVSGPTTLAMPSDRSVYRRLYASYYMQALQNDRGSILTSQSSDTALAFSGASCQTAVPLGVSLDSWLVEGSLVGPQGVRPAEEVFRDTEATLLRLDSVRETNALLRDESIRAELFPALSAAEFDELVERTVHSDPGGDVIDFLHGCEGGGCTTEQVRSEVDGYLHDHVGVETRVDIGEVAYIVLKSGHCRPAGAVVAFASGASSTSEAAGAARITVLLSNWSGPLTEEVSVHWATADGTAIAGSDYVGASGTVTFPVGTGNGASRSIMVSLVNDAFHEDDQTFLVSLNEPVNAILGSPSPHTVAIVDDDALPSLAVSDVTVAEGAAGMTTATFEISLSAPSDRTVAVSWRTRDGTASEGSDYLAGSGTVTFAAGVTARTVAVSVVGDTRFENDETFFVDLSEPVDATIADGEGQGTILNDDPPATRVFVSVTGSDLSDCRDAATPCRTLDQSILQVAPGGEVLVLRTGSYDGATVTKGVEINTPPGVLAVTGTITVDAGPSDRVVLRRLTIGAAGPGADAGILFRAGAALLVERCVIDGWDRGIDDEADGDLYVTDTTVRNSVSAGLRVAPTTAARATVDRSRFEGTSNGCGVDALAGAVVSVRASVASGNASGFCASSATAQLNILASAASHNAADGVVSAGGTVRVSRSAIFGNGTGMNVAGGILESLGNNLVAGNGSDTSGTITIVSGR